MWHELQDQKKINKSQQEFTIVKITIKVLDNCRTIYFYILLCFLIDLQWILLSERMLKHDCIASLSLSLSSNKREFLKVYIQVIDIWIPFFTFFLSQYLKLSIFLVSSNFNKQTHNTFQLSCLSSYNYNTINNLFISPNFILFLFMCAHQVVKFNLCIFYFSNDI